MIEVDVYKRQDRDGALLLISMEDNDWYISTCGYGITVFTDAGIQYIGEQIKEDLSDGDFSEAFDKFVGLCDDFITQARSGDPYDSHNLPKEPLSLIWIPISIAVGVCPVSYTHLDVYKRQVYHITVSRGYTRRGADACVGKGRQAAF